MTDAIRIKGLRELDKAFASADKDLQRELRAELATIAEPVRQTAEQLATQRIAHIGPPSGNSWSAMRVGQANNVVWVAPRQRGRYSRKNRLLRRPKFAQLLLDRAMEPALALREADVIERIEFLLEYMTRRNGFGG